MVHRAVVYLLLLAGLGSSAEAEGLKPVGVIGTDERVAQAADAAPWSAVGQINVAGFGRRTGCTGTLIAPDRVVTAAHCLYNPSTRKPFGTGAIHFVAGRHNDTWLGHAKARCIAIADGFDYDPRPTHARLINDAAVIVLDSPLAVAPLAVIGEAGLKAGDRIAHAGYGRDRRYQLSVHRDCRVIDRKQHLIATDCDTTPGQSGGPVLVGEGKDMRIAAILVGVFEGKASIGVAAARWRNMGTACERGG